VDLKRRNGIESMKGNCIRRDLLRGWSLEWPTLFQQSSIGDGLTYKLYFLFPIERTAAISAKIRFKIEIRMIQII
jgi:hypothetical protein